jgi:hypothetical protein
VAQTFLRTLTGLAQVKSLLSSDHFSVDGTMIDAWASIKSFRPKDGSGEPPGPGRNSERQFHKEKRSNDTHASTTDPDARLFRKGNNKESRLCFMENRNGLIVDAQVTCASGTAERDMALTLIDRSTSRSRRITLAGDKLFDTQGFIADLRDRNVTPHIAIDGRISKIGTVRTSAMDKRTTRHPGYQVSQRLRKRIEEGFGWAKTIGGMAKVKLRGLQKVAAAFTFTMAAYNIIRIPKLLAQAA